MAVAYNNVLQTRLGSSIIVLDTYFTCGRLSTIGDGNGDSKAIDSGSR